ncbi:hypothetical protein MRX96_041554 [Rhipicephalus microplus]
MQPRVDSCADDVCAVDCDPVDRYRGFIAAFPVHGGGSELFAVNRSMSSDARASLDPGRQDALRHDGRTELTPGPEACGNSDCKGVQPTFVEEGCMGCSDARILFVGAFVWPLCVSLAKQRLSSQVTAVQK